MNERIQELAEQCHHRYSEHNIDLDKFVELIISDVLGILADSKNFNNCTYTTFDLSQGQCVTTELAKKIKEHFGNKQ